MSTTPPPPDRPTEPLAPVSAPHVRERVVEEPVAAADPLLFAQLEDSLRSLRTAVVLLGLLSVAALAVAVYALIKSQEADRGSASSGRVARLDDRVDKVSTDLQRIRQSTSRAADRSDVDQVQRSVSGKATAEDVRKLQRTVAKVQTQVADSKRNDDTNTALDQIDQRLDDLSRQVRQLQAKQQTQP
jgi:hypothetical protein